VDFEAGIDSVSEGTVGQNAEEVEDFVVAAEEKSPVGGCWVGDVAGSVGVGDRQAAVEADSLGGVGTR
jgi:hypothetical protein